MTNKNTYFDLEDSNAPFVVSDGASSLFDCGLFDAAGGCDSAPGASDKSEPIINKHSVKYFGGFDGGTEIGFFGRWSGGFFGVSSVLEIARFAESDEDHYILLGGVLVRVEPMGARVGGLHYKYHVVWHGIDIYIHTAIDNDYICPVRVRFGAVPLMRYSLDYLYNQVVRLLGRLNFVIDRESLSRVDFQVMLPNIKPFEFLVAINTGSVVTLSRGSYSIYGDVQSFSVDSLTVKSRYVELCIYDKLKELKHTDYTYTRAFDDAYGINNYKSLCRVEVRLKGGFLRRFGVRSMCDLLRSAPSLLKYVLNDWFRILDKPKVRGHENNAALSPLWVRVQESFSVVFDPDRKASKLERVKRQHPEHRTARAVRCALGWLSSTVARLNRSVVNYTKESFLLDVMPLLDKFCDSVVLSKLDQKVHKLCIGGNYD